MRGSDPIVLVRACIEDLWPFVDSAVPVGVNSTEVAGGVDACVVKADCWHSQSVSECCRTVVWWESEVAVSHGPRIMCRGSVWVSRGVIRGLVVTSRSGSEENWDQGPLR